MKHIRTDGREAAIKAPVASRLPHPNDIRYKLDLGKGGNFRPSSFGIENKSSFIHLFHPIANTCFMLFFLV